MRGRLAAIAQKPTPLGEDQDCVVSSSYNGGDPPARTPEGPVRIVGGSPHARYAHTVRISVKRSE